jgi:cytochrome b subunit of formate dehydrogenase
MNDKKLLSEDMLIWRRNVERDIQKLGSKNKKEMNESLNNDKKMLTVIKILQIFILGVLGLIILVVGIYSTLKVSYLLGPALSLIGTVSIIILILNEKYK